MLVLVCCIVSHSTLKNAVRSAISPIATPDFIIYSDLPKVCTHS